MSSYEPLEAAAGGHVLHKLADEGDQQPLIELLLMLGCQQQRYVIAFDGLTSQYPKRLCSSVVELQLLLPEEPLKAVYRLQLHAEKSSAQA